MTGKDTGRPRKRRKQRGKGLRVRTGCAVCRARHLKCDELRPRCGNCNKADKQCVFSNATLDRDPEGSASILPLSGSSLSPSGDGQNRSLIVAQDAQGTFPHVLNDTVADTEPKQTSGGAFAALAAWTPQDEASITSPLSTLSGGVVYSAETAPLQWLGLLASDAVTGGQNSEAHANLPDLLPRDFQTRNQHISTGFFNAERWNEPVEVGSHQSFDTQDLDQHEIPIFLHFVQSLSQWIDLLDPDRNFAILVPQLAMRNEGLMKAILALSARHLSITTSQTLDGMLRPDRTVAVQYYYETLRYLQQAMQSDAYLRSDELLATVLIISTYEMIDSQGKGWERHLKGAFWIQRAQTIHGESGGLKQSIWWAWLRQDIWAAFKERRKILSFYRIAKPYPEMSHWELANRAVYLLGQCVSFSSDQEIEAGRRQIQARMDQADELQAKLEEWQRHLTPHFQPLPTRTSPEWSVKPIWINPPAFSSSMQLYNFARLLISAHRPSAGGFRELREREKQLTEAVDRICGIACTTREDASIIVSTQCLYAAGLYTADAPKRELILGLLRSHQAQIGWPLQDLGEELLKEWSSAESM